MHGISLKFQEEERERHVEFVPEQCEADTKCTTADPDTMSMARELAMNSLLEITMTSDSLQRERDTSPFPTADTGQLHFEWHEACERNAHFLSA